MICICALSEERIYATGAHGRNFRVLLPTLRAFLLHWVWEFKIRVEIESNVANVHGFSVGDKLRQLPYYTHNILRLCVSRRKHFGRQWVYEPVYSPGFWIPDMENLLSSQICSIEPAGESLPSIATICNHVIFNEKKKSDDPLTKQRDQCLHVSSSPKWGGGIG